MKLINLFFLLSLTALSTQAQKGDSLLLNETKLSRPLNVHRHQLRISGTHHLALSSTQYIESKKMPSFETGRTRTYSGISIDVKYGVTEYLQARLLVNRVSETITEPAFFDGFGSEFYIINSSSEKIGWEDPQLWLDYRLPFFGKRTDVVVNLGSTFPWMSSGVDKPTLQTQPSNLVFPDGSEFDQISTVENFNTGNGVMSLGYGVQLKHRFKHLAINFQSTYYLPLGTESVNRWELSDSGFDYVKESYTKQIPDQLTIITGIEVQIRPWLNVSGDVFLTKSRHGWNEVADQKLLEPTSSLTQVSVSYEIMTSKRLWIGQTLNLSVSGTNVYAPVLLTTSAKFNLFL